MQDGLAIAVFALLAVPGILGVWIWSAFSPSPKLDADERLLRLVMVSILSYVILGAFSWVGVEQLNPRKLIQTADSINQLFSFNVMLIVMAASTVGIVIGVLSAKVTEHEALHRAARKFGLTYKVGRSSHWDTVVHGIAKQKWIGVKFADGSQFMGYIHSFSECTEERSLVLRPVGKIKDDGTVDWWPYGHSMWIPCVEDLASIRICENSWEDRNATTGSESPE